MGSLTLINQQLHKPFTHTPPPHAKADITRSCARFLMLLIGIFLLLLYLNEPVRIHCMQSVPIDAPLPSHRQFFYSNPLPQHTHTGFYQSTKRRPSCKTKIPITQQEFTEY